MARKNNPPAKTDDAPAKAGDATAKTRTPASKNPKGCCLLISTDLVSWRQISNVTQDECTAMQDAHVGTVAHWNKGDCA